MDTKTGFAKVLLKSRALPAIAKMGDGVAPTHLFPHLGVFAIEVNKIGVTLLFSCDIWSAVMWL